MSVGVLKRAKRGVSRYGLATFAKEATLRPLHPVLAPLAGHRLRARAEQVQSVDELIDLAFGFDDFGITIEPGQIRMEIQGLLEILRERPRRRILEIGTANGGSLFLIAHSAAPDARLISVDLPQGEFGGGYPAWKVPLYKAFAQRGQHLDLIRGDSHAPKTVDRVSRLLAGEMLDFLFIDGDHTYEGVRQDFESYSPLVRSGGLVGFHDIAPPLPRVAQEGGPTLLVGEVPRFWSEIKTQYPSTELIDPAGGGYFGIGLIRV
jgi:predicted O-methyltransferase YrrM